MYDPYALPSENEKKPHRFVIGGLLGVACVLETLGFWGGMPFPPLAVMYGVASVYVFRA